MEFIRQAANAFTAGEWDRWLEFHDADMQWRTSVEDPDGTTHRGREALRRYVEQWREGFHDVRADVTEFVDVGDDSCLHLGPLDRALEYECRGCRVVDRGDLHHARREGGHARRVHHSAEAFKALGLAA